MISLAEESIQSKMPVAHWVLSWKDGEQTTPEEVDFAVEYFLQLMEWKEHQTFYAVHNNTSNLHVHILVNRVNPDTLKVHRPNRGFDIDRAHLAIAKLERIQGWANEENGVYEPSLSGSFLTLSKRDYPKLCPVAETLENATGEKSAQRIARERGHSIIMDATSWRELHEELAEVGLRFEKKGSGALVWVGDVAVKASSVDRAFSMPKLVKKLGEFEEGITPQKDRSSNSNLSPKPKPCLRMSGRSISRNRRQKRRNVPSSRTGKRTRFNAGKRNGKLVSTGYTVSFLGMASP